MLQRRRKRDLSAKALRPERSSQVLMQDFERDRPAVPCVPREVHGGHPAAAQFALQRVAGAEGVLKTLRNRVWHGSKLRVRQARPPESARRGTVRVITRSPIE